MKIIFQKKKNFWWLYLVLDHQKKKKFYTRIHIKYNKILEDLMFDNKKNLDVLHSISRKKIKNYGQKTNYTT